MTMAMGARLMEEVILFKLTVMNQFSSEKVGEELYQYKSSWAVLKQDL